MLMKFSLKNAVAIALVLAILYLLYTRRMSGGPNPPPPANCDPTPVDAKIACVTAKPSFPLAGDMINNGTQKYCCKST
jgi:hypothetical protein